MNYETGNGTFLFILRKATFSESTLDNMEKNDRKLSIYTPIKWNSNHNKHKIECFFNYLHDSALLAH